MKRLSILVLVILVLAALLAACAPTTPPDPTPDPDPHTHEFATTWTADENHHWHANTCNHGNDVIADKAAHVDEAADGKCDVCDYVLFYTFTVDAPDFVTVSGDLKGKGDVTFTASVKSIYVLSVEGAEQVGEAAVEGGIATYTFKVASLASNDVEVTISAKQTVYANVVASATCEILPLEGQSSVNGWKNYFGSVVLDIPAAGNYTLKSDDSGVSFSLTESTTSSDYSKDLTIEAAEAGEVTVYVKYFGNSTTVGSVEFEVAAIDVYETSLELDSLSGSGYVIPAFRGSTGVTVTVTIPTPGIYEITANGLVLCADRLPQYFVQTTQENETVTIEVFVDEYHEGVTADFAWNIAPLSYPTLSDGKNEIEVPGKSYYTMSFTAPAAGDYVINCSKSNGEFHTWGTYGFTRKYVAGDVITLAEGQTIEIAYVNNNYDPYVIYVEIAPYVAPAANELPMGDMSISSGFAAEYEFTATEAGKLVFVTTDFSGGSVDIKYYLNNSKDGTWINGNSTYEIALAIGDVVTVVINSEGQGSMNVSWSAGAGEGGDDEGGDLGTINNPYIFGGENIVLSADMMNPTFITIPAGMTVYIDGDASFYADENGNEYVGTSVSPTVDTTYTICANTWAGAIIMVTTTAPEGGDEGGEGGDTPLDPSNTLEIGNTQINGANAEYKFVATAYGILTLTKGAELGSVTITYSINSDDPVTLINQTATPLELYAGDVVIITVTAASDNYSSLTAAWEESEFVEPSDPGSQDNPYIFDGTEDLPGWTELGKPSFFVLVKAGTTAYILGNATFNDGVTDFTVVAPEVDTLYAVITTSPAMWGEDFLITATKPVEGGDGTRFNPYVFDGTSDVAYSLVDDWAVIFVLVKGGTTANLTGDAYFTNFTTWDMCGTSVSPTEDTLYTVYANTAAGASGVVTAEAQGGEGTDPNPGVSAEALPLGNKEIAKKDAVYSFTAATAGTLKVKQAIVMMGDYAIVTVSVNGGESVTIVPQSDYVDFALEAGDVVIISISANAYSTLQTEWVEGAAGGDEGGEDPVDPPSGGEDPVPPVEEEETIVATFEFGPNRTEPVPDREEIYNGGQKNEVYDMTFTYGQYSLVLTNIKTVYGGYAGMAHDSVGNSMIRVGTKNAGYFTFIAPEGVDKVVFYVGCIGTNDATITITGYQEGAEVVISSAEYSTDTGVYQAITVDVPEDRTITFTGKYSAINKIEYVSTGTVEGDANLYPEIGGNLLSKFDFGPNITEKLPESTEEGNSLFFAGTSQAKGAVVTLEDGNGNTLDITVGRTVYTGAYDAMGNSAIIVSKNGNDFGQFSFTVADNVDQVVFYVSGFGDTEGWFGINGRVYTVPTSANSGEYTAVVFDTSVVKTVAFLADRAYPVMIDAIELRTFDEIEPPVDPTPDPEPEQPAEPDGSQENPFVFDGTTVLSGDATFGMPSYFVMVKAGVTAYVHGNAKFGNDFGELFASVSPTEDTLYAVVADTFEGASFSISTEAPVVEEPSEPETPAPTVETTLPKIGKSIEFNSNGEYTYVAETAGNFNISQGGVATMMGGSYANVYVRINNGETIALEKNAARDFTLEAGDVVYITLEADAYSSFKVIWTAA